MKGGRVWKFGDDIDTDVIIPGRFLTDWNKEPQKLGEYCFYGLDPEFSLKVETGDMIAAGKNFGCGSSRQAAPVSILHLGISCIIAKSFARIFYRNAINIGLPVVECPLAVDEVKQGEHLLVDLDKGEIANQDSGKIYYFEPYPPVVKEILETGGLAEYVSRKLKSY